MPDKPGYEHLSPAVKKEILSKTLLRLEAYPEGFTGHVLLPIVKGQVQHVCYREGEDLSVEDAE